MSDARTRAELEDTQAGVKRLKQQLADWPALSEQRSAVQSHNAELEREVKELALQLDAAKEREITLRDELDSGKVGRAWWKSPIAPYAAVAAVIAGWWAANQALHLIDWWYWSPRVGPWLLALAPAVNLFRWVRARWRRHRRLQRLKATRASS